MTAPLLALLVLAAGLGDLDLSARQEFKTRVSQALKVWNKERSATGTVTFSGEAGLAGAPKIFFIQSADDALKVLADRGPLPKAGDVVTVQGHLELEGGRVVMRAKKWDRLHSGKLPEAIAVPAVELIDSTDSATRYNGRRIILEGRAIDETESGFVLDASGIPITVVIDNPPPFIGKCSRTRPFVRVAGAAELVIDQSDLFQRGAGVLGVRLLCSDKADILLKPDLLYLKNVGDQRVHVAIVSAITLLSVGLAVLLLLVIRQQRRHLRTTTLMAERKRMADDIHDTIEQNLVAAGMLIQLGRTKESREILLRAKAELRDIVWGLKNDDMMRLSPAEMLHKTAELETHKGIFRISCRLQGLPETLPAAQMRDLSLIVREAIGNAVKHGRAGKIAITSDPGESGGWVLRIANDGAPFDPAKAPGTAEGHFGVAGMHERARRIGATLSFETKKDWTIVKLENRHDTRSHH